MKVFSGIGDVFIDNPVIFNPKPLILVCTAKCATVMGTSHSDLEDDTVCLTGWTNDVPFVMHIQLFVQEFTLISYNSNYHENTNESPKEAVIPNWNCCYKTNTGKWLFIWSG
jgi:hypothetical protein